MELINDRRITPTMRRIRSGRKQMFREPNIDRCFTNEENAAAVLQHERPEMYAELIDSQWYWVNGCGACNGDGRSHKTYIECDKHNVCRCCGKVRSEFKGSVWGGSNGWICNSCRDTERKEAKKEAIKIFKSKKTDKYDFMHNDQPICPSCGTKIDGSDITESTDIFCHICDSEIEVQVEYTLHYSTSLKKS